MTFVHVQVTHLQSLVCKIFMSRVYLFRKCFFVHLCFLLCREPEISEKEFAHHPLCSTESQKRVLLLQSFVLFVTEVKGTVKY